MRLLLLAISCAAAREVTWYVAASRISDNSALVALRNASSLTGAYLCCGFGGVAADGSFDARTPPAAAAQQLAPFAGLKTWETVSVSNVSILAASWARGVAAAAAAAAALAPAGLSEGLLVDYEPAAPYTREHAAKYADFLSALCAALHGARLKCAMDIASWGILGADFWPLFVAAGVDRFTSMTPTYDAFNLTKSAEFVRAALAALPPGSFDAGVGSTLADAKACPMQYGWTSSSFAGFIAASAAAGVERVSVWRCDIDDSYNPDPTAPWLFATLENFLSGGRK